MGHLLKFYTAPWCVACRAVKVFIEDLCRKEGVELLVVDVDATPEAGEGITTLPTFKMGDHVLTGARSQYELSSFIKRAKGGSL